MLCTRSLKKANRGPGEAEIYSSLNVNVSKVISLYLHTLSMESQRKLALYIETKFYCEELLRLSGILKTSGLMELGALESHISLLHPYYIKKKEIQKICPYFLTNGY
jgi:hypothetical protein